MRQPDQTPQEAAVVELLAEAQRAPVTEPMPSPADIWRKQLANAMADFQDMDGIRRKAFLKGVDFAAASIQLAAVNVEAQGHPNAAISFRHLAATVGGSALALHELGKNHKRTFTVRDKRSLGKGRRT